MHFMGSRTLNNEYMEETDGEVMISGEGGNDE